jgi:hypothetical protein
MSETSIKERIVSAQKSQLQLISLKDFVSKEVANIEYSLRNILTETLKKYGLENNVCAQVIFGNFYNNIDWKPHFNISYLFSGRPVSRNWYMVNNKWVMARKTVGRKIYINNIDFSPQNNFENFIDHTKLYCFYADLYCATGISVVLAQYTVVNKFGFEFPKTHKEILASHIAGRIALHGVKEGDSFNSCQPQQEPWAIVQTKKQHYVVYYSTNGNGWGYDTVVMPDQSLNDFFFWLVGNDRQKLESIIPTKILKRLESRSI